MTGPTATSTFPPAASLEKRIENVWDSLSSAERRAAACMRARGNLLSLDTGAALAQEAGVSQMTVSRLLKKMGFQGVAALKRALREDEALDAIDLKDRNERLLDGSIGDFLKREAEAVLALAELVASDRWREAVEVVHGADDVVVAGFQMLRGHVEDFARRLSTYRDNVRYAATHDGCLSELIPPKGRARRRVLILVDIVPYGREAETVAALARKSGFEVLILTDELNEWAKAHTDLVLTARISTDLTIESTGPLATLLSLLAQAVAEHDPVATAARLDHWAQIAGEMRYYSRKTPRRRRPLWKASYSGPKG
ncbi:MAG: MurR/RpiR family transcriptional regulator [Roseovarius sp.]|uniref:MurR/RpiR family transcriptional regulator n=1 Tax=Roseovarius sp. TaxID=1486281 RepID=UPI0032EC292C